MAGCSTARHIWASLFFSLNSWQRNNGDPAEEKKGFLRQRGREKSFVRGKRGGGDREKDCRIVCDGGGGGGLFCFPFTISGPDTMTLAGFHPRKIPSQPRSSHSTRSVQHILPPPKHKKLVVTFPTPTISISLSHSMRFPHNAWISRNKLIST